MKAFMCARCRAVIEAPPLERRIEWRTADTRTRFRTVKTADVCEHCATREADQLTEQRAREVVGIAETERATYLIYETDGARFFLRSDHDTTRAIERILTSFGAVDLVKAGAA